MKAPKYRPIGNKPMWDLPDKEWLIREYVELDKPVGKIANETGAHRLTVREWIIKQGLLEPHSTRHSRHTKGMNNPAYTNGNSNRYQRKFLLSDRPAICEWCGSTENIQVHHRNHDRTNNTLSNLGWLCQHCNIMEAHIYGLVQKGRITAIIEPRERIVIEFKKP